MKAKQSLPSDSRLGKTSELLIDSARIIVDSTDPVKLIAAQIQYQMLVAKMYRQNARVK